MIYTFATTWEFDRPLAEVRAVLADARCWPLFWPALEDAWRLADGDADGVGARVRLAWRAPTGYPLVQEGETTAISERRLEGVTWGAMRGIGIWELSPTSRGCRARYHWQVTLGAAWMRCFEPAARGLFVRNHHALMRAGGRGLAALLGGALLASEHLDGRAALRLRPEPAPQTRARFAATQGARLRRAEGLGRAVLDASPASAEHAPWATFQRWRELAFLHWPATAASLRPYLGGLAPERVDGTAWVSLVCMATSAVKHRSGLPLAPRRYAQVNARTYVRWGGRSAVVFLRNWCGSRLMAALIRRLGKMPYVRAPVRVAADGVARRYTVGDRLAVEVRASGPPGPLPAGSVTAALSERYANIDPASQTIAALAHPPWLVSPATIEIHRNDLWTELGIAVDDPRTPAAAAFAPEMSCVTWPPRPMRSA